MACLPSGGATPPQSSTQHHQPPGKGPQTRKAVQPLPGCENLPPLPCDPANPCCLGEESLGFSAAQLAAPTLGGCCTPLEQLTSTTSPPEEPNSPVTPEQALPSCVKSASIAMQTSQSYLPSGSPPLLQRDPVSPAHPQENPCCLKEDDQQSQPPGNISQQCQGKPCPATGSTTPPRKRKQQAR